jgi:hypothetical protein
VLIRQFVYIIQKNETRYNQMIVAIVGTLTVIIRNNIKRRYHVNCSYYHLIVARFIFFIFCFVLEENTVAHTCLVLVEVTGT